MDGYILVDSNPVECPKSCATCDSLTKCLTCRPGWGKPAASEERLRRLETADPAKDLCVPYKPPEDGYFKDALASDGSGYSPCSKVGTSVGCKKCKDAKKDSCEEAMPGFLLDNGEAKAC
jgi:hypothetical protein